MSVKDDPLDRALRGAVLEQAAGDDDVRWLSRALGAIGVAEAEVPEVAGQLFDEGRAGLALDALLAPPCPEGSVDGEPRALDELGASDLDEPWRADEEAEDAAHDDHGAIASHASDHAKEPRHLARISLHDAELPSAPAGGAAPAARRTDRRNGGWIAGLALAAAALIGLFGVALREPRGSSSANRNESTQASALAPKPADSLALATVTPPGPPSPSDSAAPTVAVLERPTTTAGDTTGSPSKPLPMVAPPKPFTTVPVGTASPPSTATALGTATVAPTATATAPPPYVAERPEPMDVRSAVNFRMAAANACVVGVAGESRVTISFGPSGTVTGVVVTDGPAKGTGAEACIKKAFSTARVDPSRLGGTGYAVVSDTR